MKSLLLQIAVICLIVDVSNAQIADAIPKHETFKLQSSHVNEERTINVWLPKNYVENTSPFPTLYMADGGIEEDFPHIANTLEQLIRENKIPPMILVGIQNTQRRRDLTGKTVVERDKSIAPIVGESQKFRNFIQYELIPEIEIRYKTTNERSIIGESLAGLFVVETLIEAPNLFKNYIAFDPSLWWNNSYLVKKAAEGNTANFQQTKRFWFAGSNAKDIYKNTKKLAAIFTKQNSAQLEWYYSPEPKLKHATIFRATKEKALIWTFGKL